MTKFTRRSMLESTLPVLGSLCAPLALASAAEERAIGKDEMFAIALPGLGDWVAKHCRERPTDLDDLRFGGVSELARFAEKLNVCRLHIIDSRLRDGGNLTFPNRKPSFAASGKLVFSAGDETQGASVAVLELGIAIDSAWLTAKPATKAVSISISLSITGTCKGAIRKSTLAMSEDLTYDATGAITEGFGK